MEEVAKENSPEPSSGSNPEHKKIAFTWKEVANLFFLGVVILMGMVYGRIKHQQDIPTISPNTPEYYKNLQNEVLPQAGFTLPIKWGSIGQQLISSGVLDKNKFIALYQNRQPEMAGEIEKILADNSGEQISVNAKNSSVVLNLLWAFGLGNKNPILETGDMMKYGGRDKAGSFASTGGWTLGRGDAMNYYSKYEMVKLTPDQQKIVEEVAGGVYRPCCGNSTAFPDCNHGMAMLGLIEILAAQNYSAEQIFDSALQFNSFWFPETYITLAAYYQSQGIAWEDVKAREVLSEKFSSAQGFANIEKQVGDVSKYLQPAGGSCGA